MSTEKEDQVCGRMRAALVELRALRERGVGVAHTILNTATDNRDLMPEDWEVVTYRARRLAETWESLRELEARLLSDLDKIHPAPKGEVGP